MLDFIRCPTCGHNIGAVYEAFKIIKTHLYTKELEKNDSHIVIKNTGVIDYLQISMNEIFDQLNIPKYCCRGRIVGALDFVDAAFIR